VYNKQPNEELNRAYAAATLQHKEHLVWTLSAAATAAATAAARRRQGLRSSLGSAW
jgi:hypothetical protein